MGDELRSLVGSRRREVGLSYQSLAAACQEFGGAAAVSSGWLHRLETGAPINAPSTDALDALAAALRLEPARLREAAAAQFFGVRVDWEASGEAADLLRMVGALPEPQQTALVELVRVMAKDC
ncbi:helix-turn-helix domain-containing protein [Streptomyces rubrogriseus]|uniref:helix-turn-helix domain-containing protein n=1 Tax=Streptomyces rubrogriseus TaxID=194673 RepID=UPI00131EEACA|nr:helix-turn-helix domain-containing protein [Streptomyces rubrogriseus]